MTGTPLVNDYINIHAYSKFLKIFPSCDEAFFKDHFVNRATHEFKANADEILAHWSAGGCIIPKSRTNEVIKLDINRQAIMYIFLRSNSIRRTRATKFQVNALVDDIPPITRTDIRLDLDRSGHKYKIPLYYQQPLAEGDGT